MGIKIVTDSTAYIPKKFLDMYDIKVVSLNISIKDKNVRELDITNEEFYKLLDESKEFPKSSQPSLQEMIDVFEEILKDGNDIVGVFISSDFSGTYSSANLIKKELLEKYTDRKIELIDSRSNCMQMGLCVLEGAKLANKNESIEDVVRAIKYSVENSRFLFTPATLDYLKMGGRIGNAGALFGKLLKIRPILTVNDGKTDVVEKVRTKNKAVEKILDIFFDEINKKGLVDVVVHHINCEEEGIKIANIINEKTGTMPKVVSIGPVIGMHVGPGAVGVAYNTK